MKRKLSNNSQIQILLTQQDFRETLQTIQDFLYQRKEDIRASRCLHMLKDIEEKFSDLIDIYSIAPDSFPGLLNILTSNARVLKSNFNKIIEFIAYSGSVPENYDEFIYNHCGVLTEQYIKLTIEGLYSSLEAETLPSLSAEDVTDSLTFSLINLSDFFRKNIRNQFYLDKVLNQLEIEEAILLSRQLEKGIQDPHGTYLILLAGVFSNLGNLNLDSSSEIAIVEHMCAQLLLLENNSSIIEIKETTTLSALSNFSSDLLPSYLTLTGFFNTCNQLLDVSPITKKIKEMLFNVFETYSNNPKDYPGLPESLLKNARTIKERCQKYLLEGKDQLIIKEMEIFYQQMVRRHLQMHICSICNETMSAKYKPVTHENPWQDSLQLILETFGAMYQSVDSSGKKKDTFQQDILSLKQFLLWEERPLPAFIVSTQQTIIALAHFFKNRNLIAELPPKIVGEVLRTFEELLTVHFENIENNLMKDENNYNIKRMHVHFGQSAPLKQPLQDIVLPQFSIVNALFSQNSFFSLRPKAVSNLRKNALSYGFICKNVRGDGNCLFTSVALYLKHTSSLAYQNDALADLAAHLRAQTTNHIRENRNKFEAFLEDNYLFDEYIKTIGKSGTWAGEMELRALATILNTSIVVIRDDGIEPTILRNQTAQKNIIYLGYEAPGHYQLLVPKNGEMPSPSIQNKIEQTDFMDNYSKNSLPTNALGV